MIPGRAFASLLMAGLACALNAPAQQTTAIVQSEGEANVAVAPDEVKFEFTKNFGGPTLIDTATQAAVFEKSLTQALADLDSTPARQDPLRLSMPGVGRQDTVARILVSYPMPGEARAGGAAPGAPPLVELAEKIRKAGVSLLAKADFAGFGVSDRETPEQEAIARASENALYHAEAVGALLEGRVLSAERITITETRWKGLDENAGALPIPPAVECFARVQISYQYSSAAR